MFQYKKEGSKTIMIKKFIKSISHHEHTLGGASPHQKLIIASV